MNGSRAGQARAGEHAWRAGARVDRRNVARQARQHARVTPPREEHRGAWLLVCVLLSLAFAMMR